MDEVAEITLEKISFTVWKGDVTSFAYVDQEHDFTYDYEDNPDANGALEVEDGDKKFNEIAGRLEWFEREKGNDIVNTGSVQYIMRVHNYLVGKIHQH